MVVVIYISGNLHSPCLWKVLQMHTVDGVLERALHSLCGKSKTRVRVRVMCSAGRRFAMEVGLRHVC